MKAIKKPSQEGRLELEEDERNQIPVTDSIGRQQETTIVNESGLYNVILRSELQKQRL